MNKKIYLTICDELHKQGYMTDEELAKDKAYGRANFPKWVIISYCNIIKPVVLLMRRSKFVTRVVHKIVRVVWLKFALK